MLRTFILSNPAKLEVYTNTPNTKGTFSLRPSLSFHFLFVFLLFRGVESYRLSAFEKTEVKSGEQGSMVMVKGCGVLRGEGSLAWGL